MATIPHVEDARESDPQLNRSRDTPPFNVPTDAQYGIEPNATGPEVPTPAASPTRGPPILGTAEELHLRNSLRAMADERAARLAAMGPQTPSTPHLRGSRARSPPTPTAPPLPISPQLMPEGEHMDADMLFALSQQPTDQRLLALEQYVFEQHARDLFSLNLRTRAVENKMSVLLAEEFQPGPKAQRYSMTRFSSPAQSQRADEASHRLTTTKPKFGYCSSS